MKFHHRWTGDAMLGIAFGAALSFSFIPAASAIAPQYQIIDLGTLGGTSSIATGINNSGQVVGQSTTMDGQDRAFLYNNGSMMNLGTFGGISSATAINDSGQIVGYSSLSDGFTMRPFIFDNGIMTDIGSLGGAYSIANDINASGQIVGESYLTIYPPDYPGGVGASHAFLYSNGSMTDLGTLGGYFSDAQGINNAGQVVGEASGSQNHAFLYSGGIMTDLGTLDGQGGNSQALDINATGQIVGWSSATNFPRAFLYENGTFIDLDSLGGLGGNSKALAVNALGQAVGWYYTGLDGQHGFLYNEGQIVDLNDFLPADSPWTFLGQATDINDHGQIVGEGLINGVAHAYLMTPVPLPASIWLFGSGLLGLIGVARRNVAESEIS